jgi:hypothetical protein
MDPSVTRIMDLPIDNAAISTNKPLQTSPTTYTTINPHPNPYGHPPPSVPAPPAPEFQGNGGGGGYVYPPTQQPPPIYQQSQPSQQQQQLPPRDFPKNQDFYNLDEKIQVNYIPPSPPLNNDFIRKYEEEKEKEWKKNIDKKRKSNRIDDVIEKTQIPIIVAILFFIFHLPIVNNLIFQKLSFLAIYNTDGNFNMYGLILKSVFFGITFHLFTYIVELLSNF